MFLNIPRAQEQGQICMRGCVGIRPGGGVIFSKMKTVGGNRLFREILVQRRGRDQDGVTDLGGELSTKARKKPLESYIA